MAFKDFLQSLSHDDLDAFAKECETTAKYISIHLIPARKTPGLKLMRKLIIAAKKRGLTMVDVLMHFYEGCDEEAA